MRSGRGETYRQNKNKAEFIILDDRDQYLLTKGLVLNNTLVCLLACVVIFKFPSLDIFRVPHDLTSISVYVSPEFHY